MARRQLNPGQRALMALEYERFYGEATKLGRPVGDNSTADGEKKSPDLDSFWPSEPFDKNERKSTAKAARAVGASRSAVAQAKAVQRDAPDLAAKVRAGEIALDAADRQRKQRLAAMPKPEPAPKPPGRQPAPGASACVRGSGEEPAGQGQQCARHEHEVAPRHRLAVPLHRAAVAPSRAHMPPPVPPRLRPLPRRPRRRSPRHPLLRLPRCRFPLCHTPSLAEL